MYKKVLEFNFKDFDTANFIFNDFDRYFEPGDYTISLGDIRDDLYMPILKKHGFDITWEDIESNEELYELLEEMVNDANFVAEHVGFLEGYKSGYTKEFNHKIWDFFEAEEISDYIHNIKAVMDTDKEVFRIEYEYDDKGVVDYFAEENEDYYSEYKEQFRTDFEGDVRFNIKNAIQRFDKYMERAFADARGYEFYDDIKGEDAFMYRFEDLVIEYKDKLKELTGK